MVTIRARSRPLSLIPEFRPRSVTPAMDEKQTPPTEPLRVHQRPVSLKLWIPTGGETHVPTSPTTNHLWPTSFRRPRRGSSTSRPRISRRPSTMTGSNSTVSSPFSARPSLAHTLPPEIWRRILRFATLVPRLDPSDTSEFEPPHSEPLHVRRTKRALVQVCAQWRTLATPFLYEYLAPENVRQTQGLVDLFARRPVFGGHVRRIAFAVVGSRYDVRQHLALVRQLLDRVPYTAAVHVMFLSGSGAQSGLPQALAGSGAVRWRWRALDWTDPSANDPRSLEKLLLQCPQLEQLRLTGDAVASSPLPPPSRRSTPRFVLPSLTRLALRDARAATLEMVTGWTMPKLSHLTLAVAHSVPESLVRTLLTRYGKHLKFLRLEAPHFAPDVVTNLIALCPEVEMAILPLGSTLPPMNKLTRLGLVRHADTSVVLAGHLGALTKEMVPALRTLVAVESAQLGLTSLDTKDLSSRLGVQLEFLDSHGDPVSV